MDVKVEMTAKGFKTEFPELEDMWVEFAEAAEGSVDDDYEDHGRIFDYRVTETRITPERLVRPDEYGYHKFNTRTLKADARVRKQGYGFLVWQVYADGDTFGESRGNAYFSFVAATKEDAEDLKNEIQIHSRRGSTYSFDWRGVTIRLPGTGHFAHLDSVEVKQLNVG